MSLQGNRNTCTTGRYTGPGIIIIYLQLQNPPPLSPFLPFRHPCQHQDMFWTLCCSVLCLSERIGLHSNKLYIHVNAKKQYKTSLTSHFGILNKVLFSFITISYNPHPSYKARGCQVRSSSFSSSSTSLATFSPSSLSLVLYLFIVSSCSDNITVKY